MRFIYGDDWNDMKEITFSLFGNDVIFPDFRLIMHAY